MIEATKARLRLFHFSEDPNISEFRPHIAHTSSEKDPLVWAIDEEHAPSYWFPRDCPRACCWRGVESVTTAGASLLAFDGARRMHAIEDSWLERVRKCELFAYELNPEPFQSRLTDAGYWVASVPVEPISVTPLGDLLARHAEAEIELRVVRNLWSLIDAILASGLEFSIIRKANAQRRPEPA